MRVGGKLPAMRVRLEGGGAGVARLIASALGHAGLALAAEDEEFDLLVTIGGGPAAPLRRAGFEVDPFGQRARLDGRPLRLSPIEHALLAALVRATGPLARRDLLRDIWGHSHDPGTNLVAVHVARLRAKIGAGRIAWSRAGYALV